MMARFLFPLLAIMGMALLGGLTGCTTDSSGDDDDAGAAATPPVIEHTPITDGQAAGTTVELQCQVTDEEGVGSVTLFLRPHDTTSWVARFFTETEDGTWIATIEGTDVTTAGVDYYIKASDIGTPRGEATSPEGAPESFHSFATRVVGTPLPFTETFDGEGSLLARGWTLYNQGFPHYDWDITTQASLSGDASVWHADGISGLAGPILDWLISPPINLTGVETVSLSWYEMGQYTADLEIHGAYVSVGSGAPYDGEFVPLVEALPSPPEGQWGASATYDLSPYVGMEAVYIAFVHQSEWPADRWFLDDIYVGSPHPRLDIGDVTVEPGNFGPGDTVTLSAELLNVGDVDAQGVTATLQTSDPQISIADPATSYGILAAGASASPSPPWQITVDPAHSDNSRLEFVLVATDGTIQVELPFSVLMGQASTATVGVDALASGEVSLRLGAGDPTAPGFEATHLADVDGFLWEVDLTEAAALLPPLAGPSRWFVEAQNAGLYEAQVTEFTITWDGIPQQPSGLPIAIPPGERVRVWLPDPPSFVASGVVTDPVDPTPGDSAVSLGVTVRNQGTVTQGPLTGTLTSDDPHATVVDGEAVEFADHPVSTGEEVSQAAPFILSIASDHRDNSPLSLLLTLTDGVEEFLVPIEVPVPYAHPQIVATSVYDGYTGDGILDRGERIELSATVQNIGARSTAGEVGVTLSLAAESQALATLDVDDAGFGVTPLAPGDAVSVDGAFEFEVESGYMGDALIFDALLTDGVDTWTQTLSFELSGKEWIPVPGSEDPSMDAAGYPFDLAGASYRSDGEVLWLRVDSHTPFDPVTLFLDVHLYNAPSWWALEYIYEEVRLRDDYLYGDVVEPSLPIQFVVEDRSFALRVALADLDVIGHSTSVAFASGICSGSWYCDISPDTWFAFDVDAGTIGFYNDYMSTIAW